MSINCAKCGQPVEPDMTVWVRRDGLDHEGENVPWHGDCAPDYPVGTDRSGGDPRLSATGAVRPEYSGTFTVCAKCGDAPARPNNNGKCDDCFNSTEG